MPAEGIFEGSRSLADGFQPPAPWTEAQWRAITYGGGHLLVSAAAGSGKTAVLVERIIRRLTAPRDPVDMDQLLVVTFTDAAAAQMRQRITAALEERLAADPGNERLRRQLLLAPKAFISTFHSFCRWALRQHFFYVGLDPRFRVADAHEALLLQHDALDAVLAEAYTAARPSDPFTRLAAACAGAEGDEPLRRIIITLYTTAHSLPHPTRWLQQLKASTPVVASLTEEGAASFLDTAPWSGDFRQWLRARLNRARQLILRALSLASGPGGVNAYLSALQEWLDQIDDLLDACARPWPALEQAFRSLTFPRLPQDRKGEGDGEVRGLIQGLRGQARALLVETQDMLLNRSPRQLVLDWQATGPYIGALVDLTLKFQREYQRLKQIRAVLDFSDLEHLCLRLLSQPAVQDPGAESDAILPSPVALGLRSRFREVLVDEYQDTNPVQEAILRLIAPEGREERTRPEGGPHPQGTASPPEPGPSLFLVGDVKQSIYRFRLADPGLFLRRHARSQPLPSPASALAAGTPGGGKHHPPARLNLTANFRSRRNVVEGINFLFRQIFVPEVAELAYDRGEELVYHGPYPDSDDPPIEFHLLEREPAIPGPPDEADRARASEGAAQAGEEPETDPEDLTAFEREAVLVARRIRQLLEEGAQVWDPDQKVYRPARFRDVAVLLRAVKDRANALVEVLGRFGIPAYAELATGYFAATEIETMLALLAVIDNPRQDIPLAAVLRSPLVGLQGKDLAHVRLAAPGADGDFYDAVVTAAQPGSPVPDALRQRLHDFLQRLEGWRTAARRGPLSDLIHAIYRETRFREYVGALPGGRQRQRNLQALYERARQFDGFDRQGLSRFLLFIRRLQEAEGDLGTAPAVDEDEDVVRVMSVHRSKGLEFPIVIVMDVGHPFQRPRPAGRLFLFHRELGVGMMGIDEDRRRIYPTLPYLAVEDRLRREDWAEEMRILYVALTRARERLIIVGSGSRLPTVLRGWLDGIRIPPEEPLPASFLANGESWLDWLGPALCRHPDGEPLRLRPGGEAVEPVQDPSRWRVTLWQPEQVTAWERAGQTGEAPPLPWPQVAAVQPLERELPVLPEPLEARMAWRYPWYPLTQRAAKLSTSELKRRWHVDDGGESKPLLPPADFRPLRPRPEPGVPDTLPPVERGRAVHLVLQWIDLRAQLDEEGVREQVARLVREGRLTAQQAQGVDCRQLARFFASELGRRLRSVADRALREVPFTLALPVREVYPEVPTSLAEGEYVLTQGIIDLLVPLPEGIWLVDFKTDAIAPGMARQAAHRYRTQMALYRRAVREIYRQPVREAHIVFLATGEAVSV